MLPCGMRCVSHAVGGTTPEGIQSKRGRRKPVRGAPRFGSAHLRLTAQMLTRSTFCYPDIEVGSGLVHVPTVGDRRKGVSPACG
ncbi:hypothetical protein SAVIM40S_04231 [Streptomyces avidinii]